MIENVIVYLFGYAGTGKYTVAKALEARAPFTLVHNHLINNPIFSVVRVDGATPMPDGVWAEVDKVRAAVLSAITHLAPKTANFIFTNELLETAEDMAVFDDIAALARTRGARLLPVRLSCADAVHAMRIDAPERAAMFKETSVANVLARKRAMPVLTPNHPNLFELDITDVTPAAAAEMIENRIKELLHD